MNISAILLAAGESSRLGRAKQLLDLKGKSLLEISIERLLETGIHKIQLVLGARFEQISAHVLETFPEINILYNAHWETGMAGSLKIGLQNLREDCEGAFVSLSDQPLIPKTHFLEMKEAFLHSGKLISSFYNHKAGVPVIIPAKYFSELANHKGEVGARYLIRKYADESIRIPCPMAAFDIDTEEDYQKLLTSFENKDPYQDA
ncbi:MAG: nucleotidyltransferase family protein [Bacteroidota bacterium]